MDQGDVGVELGVVGVGRGTLIGEGGSARVYRAHQEHLDRDVAVKIITARGDEGIKRRFERERRAMGRLSSVPGILTVFDAGVTEAGDLYLVMPLENGGSLRDRIEQRGPMPWDEACRMMEQVAEAVEAAHSENVIHRDLKPGNILVSRRGRPLVADFGIARLMADGGSVVTTGFALTPAYSPPEAFESTETGPAIDVYGLGATLWALIAGRAPFTDAGGHTTLGVMISRIATQRPGDLAQVAPPEVCAVVDRAMAKEAFERQPSAADFGDDLERARLGAIGFVPVPGAVVAAARPSIRSDAHAPLRPVDTAAGTAAEEGNAPETPVPPTAQQPLVFPITGSADGVVAAGPERRSSATLLRLLVVVALLAALGVGAAIWSQSGDDDDDDDDAAGETDGGDDEDAGEGNDLDSPDPEGTSSPRGDETPGEPGDDPVELATVVIPTPSPDPAELLAVRGFSERTGAPTVPCPPSEVSGFRDVATNTGIGLNVRSAPDERSTVVLELAEGYPVRVLFDGEIVDNGAGDIWVIVALPTVENQPDACGWVSARFIASPTSGNLAEELQPPFPDAVPPGPFLSSCLPGWDAILFGTSVDGRFDVSICTDGLGAAEYHGSTTASGDDIRLVACQVSPGVYSAVNEGFEYRVTDGRSFGNASFLEVIGGDGYASPLTGVGGTASDGRGLASC